MASTEQEGRISALVSKDLAHGVSDVLGANAEHVEQLVWLSTAGDTRHCQSVHNNSRLCAHC